MRGHDVHVITCGDGDGPMAEYRIHDLGRPPLGKLGYLLRIRKARRVTRRICPDIVHAHYATSYGLLALASGLRPLVVTAHGSDLLIAARNPVLRFGLRCVLRRADLVTVPSVQMYEVARALAGPAVDIATFQYGVESARLEALANDLRGHQDVGDGLLRIVSARPLEAVYRTDILLDALAILVGRRDDWRCSVFGDGPERAALEQQAARLGLEDRVAFRGDRPGVEIERALATADIYASFSESDGASIALLEAMALGAIPVVSDIPASRAWVQDGVNGVVAALDPAAAARGLERSMALNRAQVAVVNQALVRERGDRGQNLGALDDRLEDLVARRANA